MAHTSPCQEIGYTVSTGIAAAQSPLAIHYRSDKSVRRIKNGSDQALEHLATFPIRLYALAVIVLVLEDCSQAQPASNPSTA
jgi:hypothetical protein